MKERKIKRKKEERKKLEKEGKRNSVKKRKEGIIVDKWCPYIWFEGR